jgi:hypothetical protein
VLYGVQVEAEVSVPVVGFEGYMDAVKTGRRSECELVSVHVVLLAPILIEATEAKGTDV